MIKPSDVDYEGMSPEDMVVVDLVTGNPVERKWKPSSDTATHLELYRRSEKIAGVVYTHSVNAVHNEVVLEKVAEMDIKTLTLNPKASMQQYVLDKHYMRKHGPNAYYGQK